MFYDMTWLERLLFLKRIKGTPAHEETSTTGIFTTDMSAPLRKLLLTMNPIQEGSGDPSPTNVRPITGWTGVSAMQVGLPSGYMPVDYVNIRNKITIDVSGIVSFDTDNLGLGVEFKQNVWKAYGFIAGANYIGENVNSTRLIMASSNNYTTWLFNNNFRTGVARPITGGTAGAFNCVQLWHDTYYLNDVSNTFTVPVSGTANTATNFIVGYDDCNIDFRAIYLRDYQTSTTKLLLIPCTDPNGVAGFYDIINGGFYTSTGATASGTMGKPQYKTSIVGVPTYSVTFPALGKNLLDFNALKTAPEGEMQGASSAYTFPHVLDMALEPNTAYTVSTDYTKTGSMQNIVYINGATSNDAVYSGHDVTVTTGVDGVLRVGFFDNRIGSEYFLNGTSYLQLEAGSSKTSYEPYNNTVYGGTLDMVSGVLTVTHVKTKLSENQQWQKSNSYAGGYYTSPTYISPAPKRATPLVCSHAKSVDSLSMYVYGTCYSEYGAWNFRIMGENTTLQDWKDYIVAQRTNGTPIEVCYQLNTPQTYQLTPQQINTLKGTNVITSDAEVTEVVYMTKLVGNSLSSAPLMGSFKPISEPMVEPMVMTDESMVEPVTGELDEPVEETIEEPVEEPMVITDDEEGQSE